MLFDGELSALTLRDVHTFKKVAEREAVDTFLTLVFLTSLQLAAIITLNVTEQREVFLPSMAPSPSARSVGDVRLPSC